MKIEKNNSLLYCLTIIGSLLIVCIGFFLSYPYQKNISIECSSGEIKADYYINFVNEKVNLTYDGKYYKSESLPQYFRLNGINNLNCKMQVSGEFSNLQLASMMAKLYKNN